MKFYGIQKTSLVDFPGEVAATLFTYGCNLRCGFCHNAALVTGSIANLSVIEAEEVIELLKKRKGLLTGVCITGGEPLLHEQLPEFIGQVKSLGYKVKLDTNGTMPEALKSFDTNKIDYIAMDIKTSLEKYHVLGYNGSVDKIKQSIEYIINSGIDHEFRTTVVPELVTLDDIMAISKLIVGANRYFLAQFRNRETLDPSYQALISYSDSVLEDMKAYVINSGISCSIRGLV